MIDEERLRAVVASNIETLCRHFFPHGKKDGSDWKIADISGAKGDSLGICLSSPKAGVWIDRATGEKGNFTQLLMRSRNIRFPQAAGEIGRCLGIDLEIYQQNGYADIAWAKCNKLTPTREQEIASWRGISPQFVRWLEAHELIRTYGATGDARWVFPIHLDGKVAGTHSRPIIWSGPDRCPWTVFPTKKHNGPGIQPLIIGTPAGARVAHLSESTWDALALCDKLSVHETDGFVVLCTRGATNARLVSMLPESVQEIYLWPQNDDAGQKWAEDVISHLPKQAIGKIVRTPVEHADLNDWTRAGATADDLVGAIKKAAEPSTAKCRQLQGGSILAFAHAKIDETKTLLGERYLCIGGGMFIVAQSGIGKSAVAIQAAALWSCGRPAFDIKPARPLRIMIVQSEDDDGDVTEAARMIFKLGLSQEEKALVAANTWVEQINDVCGDAFITELDGILERRPVDLVIINPFTAYLGSDDKDTEACIRFLRNQMNPLLTKHRCAVIPIHHTPKTNFASTENYKPSDWMYRGAGAATLTNWARAYLVIDPCEGASGVFKFIAAKRGKRIGWSNKITCFEKFFRHSKEPGVILWEPADPDEISAAQSGSGTKSVDKEKLLSLVPVLDPILKGTLIDKATRSLGVGIHKVKAAMNELELERKVFTRRIPNPNGSRSLAGWAKTPDSSENGEVGQ
jgi:hypothetical protein